MRVLLYLALTCSVHALQDAHQVKDGTLTASQSIVEKRPSSSKVAFAQATRSRPSRTRSRLSRTRQKTPSPRPLWAAAKPRASPKAGTSSTRRRARSGVFSSIARLYVRVGTTPSPRATPPPETPLVDCSRRLVRPAPRTRPQGPARRWEEGRAQDHVRGFLGRRRQRSGELARDG